MRRRHSSAISQGQGAAPDTASLRLERSAAGSAGESSSRRNMVATAGNTVTRWRAMAASTSSGTKRSIRHTEDPASSGASRAPLRPKEWASGSTASTVSAGPSAITGSAHDSLASRRARWESSAPLGSPVLPEV